jgi:hypothetical protein
MTFCSPGSSTSPSGSSPQVLSTQVWAPPAPGPDPEGGPRTPSSKGRVCINQAQQGGLNSIETKGTRPGGYGRDGWLLTGYRIHVKAEGKHPSEISTPWALCV